MALPERGQELPVLRTGPVERIDLVRYAGASGDYNPIHTVESFAREAGLGDVIAHGMLSMAYVGRMLTDFMRDEAELEEFTVRFRAMVRPGDVLECHGQVADVAAGQGAAVVKVQVRAVNQSGETVVKGSAQLRYAPID